MRGEKNLNPRPEGVKPGRSGGVLDTLPVGDDFVFTLTDAL